LTTPLTVHQREQGKDGRREGGSEYLYAGEAKGKGEKKK